MPAEQSEHSRRSAPAADWVQGKAREEEVFFFEKKNQKTFICCGQHPGSFEAYAGRNSQKFFASFFQKRSSSYPNTSCNSAAIALHDTRSARASYRVIQVHFPGDAAGAHFALERRPLGEAEHLGKHQHARPRAAAIRQEQSAPHRQPIGRVWQFNLGHRATPGQTPAVACPRAE